MSTKLSFRARALDPSKAMPIYFAEELPDLQEYSAINRAVPQMPSGMEKEEESEHHLQRAIIAGLIIPTPEVSDVKDDGFYDKNYPADYKMPRQLIHVQPLSLEQDIPDYDMDSADETWFDSQTTKSELTPFKFEQMMDRLEKITVCSLDDAKALVRRNEVNQDVFDYWVNKRLKTKHPLILAVKTENRGNTTSNNPYIAFRRRTEKMQTRKNRKNDETSYEKMLKLRRDLSRAVKLLEMVKRREKTKREELQLSIEIYEKRYQAKDFSGQLFAEYTSAATKLRPAFAPLYSNQYHHQHSSNMSSSQHNQWNSSSQNYANLHINHLQNNKREFDGLSTSSSRKEKRQYKKRKHKAPREIKPIEPYDGLFTSDDDDIHNNQIIASESEDEGIYPFRRNRNCDYFKPHGESFGNWPWESTEENGIADPRYRYNLTSLRLPRPRCIGFARRRVGRGGRILLDRASSSYDDVWSRLDYKIFDTKIDACEDRVPEIIESKMIDSNSEKDVDDVSEKVWSQNTTVQNNHHFNNIVIKSENSKTHELSDDQKDKVSPGVERSNVVNNQKLDDFEQLLDSASASSNIINKKLVCKNNSDISDESFVLKSTGSNSTSQSELLNKNLSVGILNSLNCEASSSGVSSTNGSLSFNLNNLTSQSSIIELSSLELDKQANDDESGSEMKPETSCSEHPEDFFEDLIDEIKNEWLHFRPRTPTSPQPYDVMFDSDFIDKTKKFAVELQIMDDDFKETDLSSYVDNVYSSQPMSFDVSDRNILMNDNMENTMNVIKTEPSDKDYDFIDEIGSTTQEPTPKTIEQDAVKKLLQKYQNDVDNEESLEIDVDGLDFGDCLVSLEPIGCSSFKLHNEDLLKTFKTESSNSGKAEHNLEVSIKSEALEFPINPLTSSVQQMSNTAPIAELQSHNYVLQYGSPVTSNTVTLSTLTGNSSMMCGPNVVTSAVPATTLFQQPFVNSGSTIITTPQQSHQSKLQPIVYDNNTFVLTPTRKQQLNGPSDRNSNQNKYKQVFMLDLTQGQDKRKSIGDNSAIKKTYADLALSNQNILVSSVNSNILSTNPNNLQQQTQTQQYSLVHQNALQKPIILSTSTSGGPGTLIQSSQTSNAGNKIIVTPASQIAGNVYVSTHGKLVIPSSNNSQSIILDSSKMMSTNNQLQSQPKLQSHQQRVKMENKMNMLLENSGEKNIIYAKYNKSKLLQTVANIIPMQSTANKSGMQAQNQIVKQIQPITSSPQQQSIGIISNTKTLQRIHQQPILRTQFGSTSVNFQNSPTSSKMIQQPNNGNSVLGSVNNNNDNSSQVNSTTTPTIN